MKTLEYTEDTAYADGESVSLYIEITPAERGDSLWKIAGYTDDDGYHDGEPERELQDGLWYVQRDVNLYVEEFKDTLRELEYDD
jgi:hypothetical protein